MFDTEIREMYSLNHEVPRTRGDIEQTSEKFMTSDVQDSCDLN
jgi:hypothetical protein